VVSPVGRPLHAYTSEALRDAIAGHKSLLEDRKIFHRDIHENNIIFTDAATERDLKGRLIDLDSRQGNPNTVELKTVKADAEASRKEAERVRGLETELNDLSRCMGKQQILILLAGCFRGTFFRLIAARRNGALACEEEGPTPIP
jgi:hypothetical protein